MAMTKVAPKLRKILRSSGATLVVCDDAVIEANKLAIDGECQRN